MVWKKRAWGIKEGHHANDKSKTSKKEVNDGEEGADEESFSAEEKNTGEKDLGF